MKYDFFIAYASPDKVAAEELSWQLQDLDRIVFLDKDGIVPGANWDLELSDALDRSQVVIVLVSSHSAQAHYQRDEIARAIARSRENPDAVKVVPVMLPGAVPARLPYGLSTVQSINANAAGGMKRVAKTLSDLLPLDGTEQIQARRNAYYALGAALRLNRVKQWTQILEASQVAENALFLLHGPHDQNVGLFLERIQRFFSQELTVPHDICRVRFYIQGQTPRTGTDWLAHLRDALQCTGPLGPWLRQKAQQKPVFIMLGQNPLPLDRLTDQHIDALREFITDNLPTILRESRVLRGIGVMLALDYEVASQPLIAKFVDWGARAEASDTLRFRALPQASLPSWEDVHDYLTTNVTPRPQADQIALIRQEYDRRASNPELTFEKLARLIDRYTLIGH